jgi:hypothetical protein
VDAELKHVHLWKGIAHVQSLTCRKSKPSKTRMSSLGPKSKHVTVCCGWLLITRKTSKRQRSIYSKLDVVNRLLCLTIVQIKCLLCMLPIALEESVLWHLKSLSNEHV